MSGAGKATVKIINPEWPADYIVINHADFDAAHDQLWDDAAESIPRTEGAPREPEPLAPPAPVAVPPVDPMPPDPDPPHPMGKIEALSAQRIVDLGPWIAACDDVDTLRRLRDGDARATIRRMIDRRLRELKA